MFRISSRFSPYLTSYDFVKFFAIVTMVIDHVGFFFFPEQEWWRVIGRTSFPCWMFLIGYARSREIPKSFMIGGALLIFANIVFSHHILPVNVLLSFMITRVVLDRMARVAFREIGRATIVFWSLLILALPTYLLFEYGTLGFLIALLGYAVRNKEEISEQLGRYFIAVFALAVTLSYVGYEMLFFGLTSGPQPWVLAGLVALVVAVLVRFSPEEYPRLTQKMPSLFCWILQFGGRYSLEIYVAHVVVFMAVSQWMSPDFVPFKPQFPF